MKVYYVPDDNVVKVVEVAAQDDEPPQEIRIVAPVKVGVGDSTESGSTTLSKCTSLAQRFRGVTREGTKFYFYARPDTSLDRFAIMVRLIKAQYLSKLEA